MTKNMYFNCPTLRATMSVTACQANRDNKKNVIVSCQGCTKWQALTTNPANLLTIEQALAPAQAAAATQDPQKFDLRGEINRVCNLHIGHVPYRDTNRKY